MHRRNMLWGAVSAIGAAFAASRAGAATEPAGPARLKVAYHLNDLDKVNFVLGNIQNHLDGAFHAASANPDLSRRVGHFSQSGLELAACGNTMKSQNVGLKDLLPGFISADKGGVVRLAELQSQGYLYLRP